MSFIPGSFGEAFIEGFEDNAPENYDYSEDSRSCAPWCAPWLCFGVNTNEWFDADKTAYEMGWDYAKSIYDVVEREFSKEEA